MTDAFLDELLADFSPKGRDGGDQLTDHISIWLTAEDKALYDRLNEGRQFTKVARLALRAVMRRAASKAS